MTDIRALASGMRASELAAEERAGGAMTTETEFRDPATRQQNPDLDLRQVRAALKPLLDKLDALEAQHGASLSPKSTVLTTVGVLQGIAAAGGRADG
jgi:hypothetical protein